MRYRLRHSSAKQTEKRYLTGSGVVVLFLVHVSATPDFSIHSQNFGVAFFQELKANTMRLSAKTSKRNLSIQAQSADQSLNPVGKTESLTEDGFFTFYFCLKLKELTKNLLKSLHSTYGNAGSSLWVAPPSAGNCSEGFSTTGVDSKLNIPVDSAQSLMDGLTSIGSHSGLPSLCWNH